MAFDFFDNGIKANNGFSINSVQSRNSFVANNSLATRDPMTMITTSLNKSFEMQSTISKRSNELLSNMDRKLSDILDILKGGSKINLTKSNSNPIAYQSSRETEVKTATMLNSMKGFFEKSLDVSQKTLKKIGDIRFANVGKSLSLEAMAVIAILLINKLGLGNISDTIKGINNAYNSIKTFGANGLLLLEGLRANGLNILNGLKAGGLGILESLKAKGLPYLQALRNRGITALESLRAKGLPYLESFKTRGLIFIQGFSTTAKARIIDLSVKGLNAFNSMRVNTVNIFSKMSNGALRIFNTIGSMTKSVFGGLKTGFTSLFNFMGKLGSSIGEVLSKIPGMGALKSLGKFALNTAGGLFAGYDFAEGVADAERITGEQRASGLTGKAQGFVGGALNMGTGFVNSFLDLGTMATGKDMGRVDPKGVYMGLTGTDSEYMGQNIQGKSGLDRISATASYYMPNTLSGKPMTSKGGSKRNGKPVDNMKISSYPAPMRGNRPHKGTDIAVPSGTPVYATASGKVFIGNDPKGWGTYIEIRHSGGYMTRYAHLSKINVSNGQMVNEGDLIGLSGGGIGEQGSGNSRGQHLHYELWKDGQWLNPFGGENKSELVDSFNMQSVNQGSSGAVMSNSQAVPSSALKDIAFNGIIQNEGSGVNPTQLRKDDGGYTFGKSQFNSGTNPNSWKQLGFNQSEISAITSGNFDKASVQSRLNNQSDKINQMDIQNKNDLFNWTANFGKSNNIDISNPVVFANIMDIGNQFNKNDINKETASKLVKFSGSRKITPDAVMQWRNQTLQARKSPNYKSDQSRRFNNLKKAVATGIVATSMGGDLTEYSGGGTMSGGGLPEIEKVSSFNVKSLVDKTDRVKEQVKQVEKVLQDPIAKRVVLGVGSTDIGNKELTLQDRIILKVLTNPTLNSGLKQGMDLYNSIPSEVKTFGSDLYKNKDMLGSLGNQAVSLGQNFNLSNVIGLGSSIINNKDVLNNLGLKGLGLSDFDVSGLTNATSDLLSGKLTNESLSKIGVALPSEILTAGNSIVQNKSALNDVASVVLSTMNNPNDIVGNLSKIGGSILQNKEGLGNIAGSLGNIFSPKTVTQSEVLLQTNQDMMIAKETAQQQPIIIPMPSAQQDNPTRVINKSMNINDMYLMTLVSGVFD
jgi:murein DD-endopeptidase MepM/ murein hydrolase activator NlpD